MSTRADYKPIYVWSVLHRLVHWGLALSVFFQVISAIFAEVGEDAGLSHAGEELIMGVHAKAGFVFAFFVLARVAMLIFGKCASNWRDIVPTTGARIKEALDTIKYYLSGLRSSVPLYFGHNAFAGLIYSAFIIIACSQAVTGLTMYAAEDHEHTPVAMAVDNVVETDLDEEEGEEEGAEEALHELHEVGAFLILLYIFAHLGALTVHELVERRGTISSMVGGYKFFDKEERDRLGLKD